MRERFNAVVNEDTLLRFTYAPGGTPTDVFDIIEVNIYDEDPRVNPSAVPIQIIPGIEVVHADTGQYSYIKTAVSDAGLYYDEFKFEATSGSGEESSVQQIVVNQSISTEPTDPNCPFKNQERAGYTFGNYQLPEDSNCWGSVGTPDDLRYTYLFGIDLKAQNGQEVSDAQLQYMIDMATEQMETLLGIVIKKRVYKTNPAERFPDLVRGDLCQGADYSHEDDEYPYNPNEWRNYGVIHLRHFPVLTVERAILYTVTKAELQDLIKVDWLRLDKKRGGGISIYPKKDSFIYGPPSMAAGASWLWLRTVNQPYPGGFEFDYTAGYENSNFIDVGLREAIMKLACIGSLQWIGDGLLAGFSSSSISLDGLSESFSSTQSATSAYFGARILSLQNEFKEWLKKNRYKYNNVPLSFIN